MVFGNSNNPQVTPTGVYYPPRGKPPYPPLVGQPIVGYVPMVGGQPFTGKYGQIPQPSLGQPTVTQPFLGTPYPRTNTIWNPSFT